MQRTPRETVKHLAVWKQARLDAQRLLHLIPASDPDSLTTARLIVWNIDRIIAHLERELDATADRPAA